MIWSRWPLGAQPNGGDPPPIAQEIEMVVIDLNTMEILPKTYTGHKGFTDSTVGQKIYLRDVGTLCHMIFKLVSTDPKQTKKLPCLTNCGTCSK